MEPKKLGIILLTVFFIYACKSNFEDEKIGLYIDYKGLTSESIQVFQNQIPLNNKRHALGDQITINIKGIDDFKKLESGFVNPGAEYAISDSSGNLLTFIPDLFKKYGETGVPAKDAEDLKLNLTLGQPMKPGNTYYYLFRIWDKQSKKELKGNIELNIVD
ncbi:hypothetical protein [Jiulongibacter sp. NS-SX5]|uniref:hypothetical protein n=1 Tax=Jiulongibacter sp. NS-SX5 TaxID=3463854 RepID=UPI00405925E7